MDPEDLGPQRDPHLIRQVAEGFVHEQGRGRRHHRPHELHEPPLPFRKGRRASIEQVRDPELGGFVGDAFEEAIRRLVGVGE